MLETSPLWEAIALWEEITGVAVPNADGSFKGTFGDYDIHQTYKQLRETLELDPSEVTTNLLFNVFVKQYLAGQTTSMMDMINDPIKYQAKLEAPRKLLAILNRPEIIEARDEFLASLSALADKYGAGERPDVQKTLTQHDLLSYLRRDALRAGSRLRVHQFMSGAPEPEGYKPVYVNIVHQWWNINSLLEAAMRMPSGISLNLIRDPDAYQSFFCYCIRNGANLFLLTDAPEHSHPLQGLFTRKPERQWEARVSKSWFPYDLLGLKWNEEIEQYEQGASTVTALATYQNQHLPLKPFNELDPAEFFWCSMMLDLIVEKFWRQNYQAPALSYTGEMLKIEHRLEASAAQAGLPVVAYQPLSLPALTIADMKTDLLTEEAIGKGYHQPNKWLEERFAHKVPESVLNIVAEQGNMVLVDRKTGEIETESRDFEKKLNNLPSWASDSKSAMLAGRAKMEVLNPTRFGSREELDNDRKFIARYNYAGEIGRLAKEEFNDRSEDILKWYAKAVKKNLPNLLAYAACENLWAWAEMLPTGTVFDFMRSGAGPQYCFDSMADLNLSERTQAQWAGAKRERLNAHMFTRRISGDGAMLESMGFKWTNLGDYEHRRGYLCALNDTKATYMQCFHPASTKELAVMAGVPVEKLPDVLQNWTLADPYDGNHILSRIDPLNWVVRDPWQNLNFQVGIPLSIRALAKLPAARLPDLENLIPADKIVNGNPTR